MGPSLNSESISTTRNNETLTATHQTQMGDSEGSDSFTAFVKQNEALAASNTTTTPTYTPETQTPVTQAESLSPEAMAEEQMMKMRAQIDAAKAEAQARERGELMGENIAGVTGHEVSTGMNATDPQTQEELKNRIKNFTPEEREAFLTTPEIPAQVEVVEKKSLFAKIISAPGRIINKVVSTVSSAWNWAQTEINALADKISSILKPTPPQTA